MKKTPNMKRWLVKIRKKCHNHEAQPSRWNERRWEKEQKMTKQMSHMKLPTHKQIRTAPDELTWNSQMKNYRDGCVFKPVSLNSCECEIASLILMQFKWQKYVQSAYGPSISSVKHHSETHIITNSVMKQSTWQNRVPELEHKTITNRTTISPTIDINRQAPTIWAAILSDPPSCN